MHQESILGKLSEVVKRYKQVSRLYTKNRKFCDNIKKSLEIKGKRVARNENSHLFSYRKNPK